MKISYGILGLIIAACGLIIGLSLPQRKTIIKTVTNQISIITEKKLCDNADGNFSDNGSKQSQTTFGNWTLDKNGNATETPYVWEISCTKTNQVFDYKLSQ